MGYDDAMNDTAQKLLAQIDDATVPARMSAQEAHDVLGELRDDIQMRMEALREENSPESDEW